MSLSWFMSFYTVPNRNYSAIRHSRKSIGTMCERTSLAPCGLSRTREGVRSNLLATTRGLLATGTLRSRRSLRSLLAMTAE